ncbi:MAG: S41 family peptidase [Candidatus Eremiobacteraeota bacterium]|nr:S41 family peptidase [Candidatus Eremiobacteraeota bacterium]
MNWEAAVGPYQPIRRRAVNCRRLAAAALCLAVVAPYGLARRAAADQTLSMRVFEDVAMTVQLRYYDPNYNGVAWEQRVNSYRPLMRCASGEDQRYRLLRKLLAPLGDSHTAVFSPTQLKALARGRDDGASHWRMVAPGVAYLRIDSFADNADALLQSALADVRGVPALVLDLRANPGGLVDTVDAVAGAFLPAGTPLASGTRRYRWFRPERFTSTADFSARYSGRLVVIVDGTTQSGAEMLARALQFYHRALIVGMRSAGKVLGVDVEERLPDGGLLRVATIGVRDPGGAPLEARGVRPDLSVSGSAAQLRAALTFLRRSPAGVPAPPTRDFLPRR